MRKVAYEPPSRLVYSWVVKYDESMTAEGPSRVTWELEDKEDGITKLTVIHDDFPSGRGMALSRLVRTPVEVHVVQARIDAVG